MIPRKSHLLISLLVGGCLLLTLMAWSQTESKPAVDTSKLTNEILNLIKQKKWDQAEKALESLEKINPESEQTLLFQVSIYFGLDRQEECQERAQFYLQKYAGSPNRDQVLYFYANSLYLTERIQEAIAYMREVDRTTRDPLLKKNCEILLRRWNRSDKIGIELGGDPPKTAEEMEQIKDCGLRILRMALGDYFLERGTYPDKLEQLLEGPPAFLKRLPEDPYAPGQTFIYQKEGDSYRLEAHTAASKQP